MIRIIEVSTGQQFYMSLQYITGKLWHKCILRIYPKASLIKWYFIKFLKSRWLCFNIDNINVWQLKPAKKWHGISGFIKNVKIKIPWLSITFFTLFFSRKCINFPRPHQQDSLHSMMTCIWIWRSDPNSNGTITLWFLNQCLLMPYSYIPWLSMISLHNHVLSRHGICISQIPWLSRARFLKST